MWLSGGVVGWNWGGGGGGGGVGGVVWRVADNQEQDTLEICNVCYSYLFRTHSICFNQTRLEYVKHV